MILHARLSQRCRYIKQSRAAPHSSHSTVTTPGGENTSHSRNVLKVATILLVPTWGYGQVRSSYTRVYVCCFSTAGAHVSHDVGSHAWHALIAQWFGLVASVLAVRHRSNVAISCDSNIGTIRGVVCKALGSPTVARFFLRPRGARRCQGGPPNQHASASCPTQGFRPFSMSDYSPAWLGRKNGRSEPC